MAAENRRLKEYLKKLEEDKASYYERVKQREVAKENEDAIREVQNLLGAPDDSDSSDLEENNKFDWRIVNYSNYLIHQSRQIITIYHIQMYCCRFN